MTEETTEALEAPTEAAEAVAVDTADEALARIHGWRPKAEYKGDKPFVEATDYLAQAQEVNPLLKAQNKRLVEANRDLTKKSARLEKMIEQVKGFEERAYKRALDDLQARHDDAVETGDVAASRKVLREMDDLKAEVSAKPEVDDEPEFDPVAARKELNAWIDENDWYETDDAKRRYADRQAEDMGPAIKWDGGQQAWLAELGKRVERKFAERKPLLTNGGGNRAAPTGAKGYADLDPQGKQMAQQMVKAGLFKTTDEYAKEVFASA